MIAAMNSEPTDVIPNEASADPHANTTTSNSIDSSGSEERIVQFDHPARQVSFDEIHIYEHAVLLGDNPGGISGPPLTIDWNYQGSITMPVDDYESGRPERRNKYQFTLPEMVRIDMLKQSGYSRQEIVQLTAPVNRAREQRKSSHRAAKLDPVLEFKETVGRKLRNLLSLGQRKRAERRFLEWSRQFDLHRHEDVSGKEGVRSSIRTTETNEDGSSRSGDEAEA